MGSRLGIYNWPYVYISWGRKNGLQAGHLQLASCLHFLRREIGGLQVRHLKSGLLFALQDRSYDRDRVK